MKILGKKSYTVIVDVINPKFPEGVLPDNVIEKCKFWGWDVECKITKEHLFITKKRKVSNKQIVEGSKITVERWDGNGVSEDVEVLNIVNGTIICDKGVIPEYGADFVWKGKKSESTYWKEYHCFIDWDKYWMYEQ